MYALVESNTIVKTYNNPRGITIGGVQYPQNIHSLWSESELNAIGVYTVIEDNTNKKDEEWYINTNQTLAFAGGVVTATYGTATAKAIAELKTAKKEMFNGQAAQLLAKYDWYVIRNTEASTAIPSAITDYRTAVRTKCNSMQVQIDNAADVDALATLFTRVNTGTEENPVIERPLGEFPDDPNNED
jgi:hypothetical protein